MEGGGGWLACASEPCYDDREALIAASDAPRCVVDVQIGGNTTTSRVADCRWWVEVELSQDVGDTTINK